MNHKEFFKKNGESYLDVDSMLNDSVRVEDLYQAFKARMLEEMAFAPKQVPGFGGHFELVGFDYKFVEMAAETDKSEPSVSSNAAGINFESDNGIEIKDCYQASREALKSVWEDAPDWANWLAQDADGKWWWYEKRPSPFGNAWCSTTGNIADHRNDKPNPNWRDTLQERPRKQSSED